METRSQQTLCACRINPDTGYGVITCMYHARVIAEHQRMWHALHAIANGDPPGSEASRFAAAIRATVNYRHTR